LCSPPFSFARSPCDLHVSRSARHQCLTSKPQSGRGRLSKRLLPDTLPQLPPSPGGGGSLQGVRPNPKEAVEEVSPDLERPCGPPTPGPSALLACVLHEYACSGARRPGRIRTTWPPDLSAPFLNSLLAGRSRPGRHGPYPVCEVARRPVARRLLLERWVDLAAHRLGDRAPGVEAAAAGRVDRRRDLALEVHQPALSLDP